MGSLIVAGYDLLDPSSRVRLTNENPTLGDGVPDTKTVARLLLDGDVVAGSRTGNRKPRLPVLIDGGTYADRVALYNRVAAAVKQPQWQMPWTPGEDGEVLPTVVFDCFRGTADRDWPLLLANPESISAVLEFETLPFTRDQDLTVIAPQPGGTSTTLNALTSATGLSTTPQWVANQPASTLSVSGGKATARAYQLEYNTCVVELKQTFGAPKDLSGAAYISWSAVSTQQGIGEYFTCNPTLIPVADRDVLPESMQSTLDQGTWAATLIDSSGRRASIVARSPLPPWSTATYRFPIANALTDSGFDLTSVSTWRLRYYGNRSNYDQAGSNNYREVTWIAPLSADPAPQLGAASYTQAVFASVGGAVRTPVGVNVDAGANKAQRVLLMRTPNTSAGFTPFLTSPAVGSSTADATALSGTYKRAAAGKIQFQVPARAYGSTYGVLARVRNTAYTSTSTLTTIPFTVSAFLGSDAPSQIQQWALTAANMSTADLPLNAWKVFALGALTLPPRGVSAGNGNALATIQLEPASLDVDLVVLVDQARDAASIWIDLPDSIGAKRYWTLTVPSSTDRAGALFAGDQADGSDAVSVTPWMAGDAVIHFEPGDNTLALLLDKAGTDATATVSFYRRWFGEAEA